MNTFTRRPEWTVRIRRPDYTKSTLIYQPVPEWSAIGSNVLQVQFVSSADKSDGIYSFTDLIGYEYSNQLSNPAGPFTLDLVPIQDGNGLTWKDKIIANDIVSIHEFGVLRYIGIVRNTSYSMSMSNGMPNRSVSISGESIGGKLQSFSVPMNKYLWFNKGVDAGFENDQLVSTLVADIEEGQDIGKIFKLIKDTFLRIVFGSKTTGLVPFIDEFLDLDVDRLEAFYPLNIRPFQVDSNTLWSIFRQILPLPIYEIFGRFEEGKYKMVCREAPFDLTEWSNLKSTTLNPLYLISQNLNDSDSEVYTHYYAQMPNNAFSENENYANNNLQAISIFDEDKLAIYGYKQLQANFPFFDINKGRLSSFQSQLKNNTVRMFAWFRNNVEFQSGEIIMHSVSEDYVNIGEKIRYMEGSNNAIEFYVEGVKRKMVYPETMTSAYSITRGYEYGSSSVTVEGITVDTPQIKKISQLGRKLIQVEKDIFQRAGKV